jgi:hypothetical protein
VTGRGWLGIALAVLLLIGGALAWVRFEGDPPSVEGPTALLIGSAGSVAFEIGDLGSGLREIAVSVQQGDGETVVFERSFPRREPPSGSRSRSIRRRSGSPTATRA